MRIGSKVKVKEENGSFTGEIEQIIKWENPFSVFHKKGKDYIVRADDDNKLYKCHEKDITTL